MQRTLMRRARAPYLGSLLLLTAVAAIALGGPGGLRPASALAADRGLDRTPPMGWNSWNTFGKAVDEDLIKRTADAMVTSGMRDAGYDSLVVDGGWRATERDADGNMQANEKFPDGMKALADYVHRRGLRFGLHQAVGMTDCGGTTPGTQSAPGDTYAEKARRDARTFAGWGIDYVKFDRCRFEYARDSVPGAPDVDAITVRQGDHTIVSREAEASRNRLGGGARVSGCAHCSGGEMVAPLGLENGSLTVPDITVPAAGDYTLDLRFVYVNRGQFDSPTNESYGVGLSVNGGPRDVIQRQVAAPEDGTVFTMSVVAHLQAGRNRITLDNPASQEEELRQAYLAMGHALDATRRPIVYSLSGPPRPWLWAAGVADLARTYKDIKATWLSPPGLGGVMNEIDATADLAAYAGPGYWNDPDILEVGVEKNGVPGLTADENRSHFSMWAMMAAPLMAGADLRDMSDDTRRIFLNREVIAVDQDRAGIQGTRSRDDGDQEVWVKPLAGGDRAVALLNRGEALVDMRTSATEIGMRHARAYQVRDLWKHEQTASRGQLTATVPAHGVVMLRVSAKGD